MMNLTNEQLKKIYPYSTEENRQKYLPYINSNMRIYGVDTPEKMAAFLAQIGHESGQLRYSEEIASGATYEGRKDLGNTQKGDGIKYKGRGLIQITGRANYTAFDHWVSGVPMGTDFILSPELLSRPEFAVLSAFWFWDKHKLNQYADLKEDNFKKITKIINGGYNGYSDRKQLWDRAKEILTK